MDTTNNNLKQNAALTASFTNLISYLRTDWPELVYAVAQGEAYLMDVIQTSWQSGDRCQIDGTGFFMVTDMMQGLSALMDYIKPFADYALRTEGAGD